MRVKQQIGTGLIALLFVMCAASAGAGPVTVKVSESSASGVTTYSYQVENGTDQPIVGFRIGFDAATGEAQLHATPLGWTLEEGLTTSSTAGPFGWTARLVTTEESDVVDIEWSSDEAAQWDINAGSTATFSVRLAQPSVEYRTSAFEAILGNGTRVSGTIESVDATPPTLNVTLSPAVLWSPNRKMEAITATVTVSDDTDPSPAVRLVSITANEPLDADDIEGASPGTDDRQFSLRAERTGQSPAGRIYTVTYSAADAAGNVATTTATVTVPHDQRR